MKHKFKPLRLVLLVLFALLPSPAMTNGYGR